MTAKAKPSTALVGEVLESMPAANQALAAQVNPYLGMLATMIERGGDVANIDKFLDLQLKWEANEARKAYVAAMAAFKAEPMEILKRKVVSFTTRDGDTTTYSHAELSDITDVVVPAMGKHGLSHRWDIQQAAGAITVTCTITHALGHSESVSMTAAPDSSGKKNAIQQVASANSYLQRYTLLAITGMATKGMDDDSRAWDEDDAADDADNQQDADWIRTCNQIETMEDFQTQRAKLLADYGKVDNVPLVVRNALSRAMARSMPKDEA